MWRSARPEPTSTRARSPIAPPGVAESGGEEGRPEGRGWQEARSRRRGRGTGAQGAEDRRGPRKEEQMIGEISAATSKGSTGASSHQRVSPLYILEFYASIGVDAILSRTSRSKRISYGISLLF